MSSQMLSLVLGAVWVAALAVAFACDRWATADDRRTLRAALRRNALRATPAATVSIPTAAGGDGAGESLVDASVEGRGRAEAVVAAGAVDDRRDDEPDDGDLVVPVAIAGA